MQPHSSITGSLKFLGGEFSQKRVMFLVLLTVALQHIPVSLQVPAQYRLVTLTALLHWSASRGTLYTLVVHVSHFRVLQTLISSREGQFPFISFPWEDRISRDLICVPPSQVSEHSPHSPHSLTSHCLCIQSGTSTDQRPFSWHSVTMETMLARPSNT